MTDAEHAGAGINLILILIFNWIYERVAFWLTDKELRWIRVYFTPQTSLYSSRVTVPFLSPLEDVEMVHPENYGTTNGADPDFFHPGSEFFPPRIPDPHQRI
jgi:hypothetical protein